RVLRRRDRAAPLDRPRLGEPRRDQPRARRAHRLDLVRRVAGGLRSRGRLRRLAAPEDSDAPVRAGRGPRGHRGAGMTRRLRAQSLLRSGIAALGLVGLAACDDFPGRPRPEDRPLRPTEVVDFDVLYSENCAGCHGADGTLGAARPLKDTLYIAWSNMFAV